ncbi:ATP-binding protein [Bermanella sp. R86510]|uniref:ATP-binding protein n=1 Tax=unclassified Bermanella TaxID=2627862 RepID=UPI0037CB0C2A
MSSIRYNFSLTGRILLSIWLVLIFTILIVAGIFKLNQPERDDLSIPNFKLYDQIQLKLLNEDLSQVTKWFKQQPRQSVEKIYITQNGKEILKRKLPRSILTIKQNLSTQRPYIHSKKRGQVLLGRLFLLPNGQYVKLFFVTRVKPKPPYRVLLDNAIYMVFLMLLISGLISWLLARYWVNPIIKLRKATQKLSRGDLTTRIAPKIKQGGEITLLASDFDAMADNLERSINSHKHLIQDISHELRSPISRLQLATELAKQSCSLNDQRSFLRIEKEIEQINHIITTLLNLPAYELEPHLALQDSIDLIGLVDSICKDAHYQVNGRQIMFDTGTLSSCIITANAALLRSAIENIIQNAIRYHEGNTPIEVKLEEAGQDIIIRCCDQGQGVENAQLDAIFKPFFRTSTSRDRASGGNGLGLAISKRAVELHGGQIYAQNRLPKGLCIIITLPRVLRS